MARSKTENLTPLELEIMHVLWETGPANVMTVQQKLKRELAYTTVQTMLNILHKKGKAKRTLKDRAYFYKPAVSRKQVVSKHVIDVVDRLFGGSAKSGYELAGNETPDSRKVSPVAETNCRSGESR